MITTLCTIALSLVTTATCPEPALASRYDLTPTEATLSARLEMGHITAAQVAEADSFVAVKECGRIGEWVYIRPVGGEWLKALIYDCATRGNEYDQHFMDVFAVEVDAWTAEAWDFTCLCPFHIEIVEALVDG